MVLFVTLAEIWVAEPLNLTLVGNNSIISAWISTAAIHMKILAIAKTNELICVNHSVIMMELRHDSFYASLVFKNTGYGLFSGACQAIT